MIDIDGIFVFCLMKIAFAWLCFSYGVAIVEEHIHIIIRTLFQWCYQFILMVNEVVCHLVFLVYPVVG